MHQLSPISTAIVSASQWDILDFEDVEKDLANKLTDNDISAVLKSINARDMLKRLKLCGCTNITGIGLNPLRGSAVLEQVDLSFVGKHGKTKIAPMHIELKISDEAVVPILESIISTNGCSLKYILYPWRWRAGRQENELLAQFQRRYNAMFRTRSSNLNCSHCSINMRDHQNWMISGLQNNICYDCLKPFCSECSDEGGEGDDILKYCCICEKDYCQNCIPVIECARCNDKICKGCENMKTCHECNQANCKDCIKTCDGCKRTLCAADNCVDIFDCHGCSKVHCSDCYNGKEHDVKFCEECDTFYCSGCRVEKVKKDGMASCQSNVLY